MMDGKGCATRWFRLLGCLSRQSSLVQSGLVGSNPVAAIALNSIRKRSCFALLCFALLCFALLLRVVDAPKSGFGSSGRTRDAIYTTLLQSAPAFDQSESCRRLLGQLPLSPASCYTVLCCAVCPAAPALNSPHCLPSFFPTPSDIAQHVGQAAKVTYPPPLD